MTVLGQWEDWPGKSAGEPGGPEHPAICHMLDVAAVAERLIAGFGFAPPLREALVLLVALHDLGKFSDSFRAMLRTQSAQDYRHWELSEILLHLCDDRLERQLGGAAWHRQMLYAATAGHHGRPSDLPIGALGPAGRPTREVRKGLKMVGAGIAPACEAVDLVCALWPRASLEGVSEEAALALSWWLPGFCAAADWIGSNPDWFAPQRTVDDLAGYLGQSRLRAEIAVTAAGLAGNTGCAAALFDFPLRPMQSACRDIALPEGPALVLIEDETGAGKTEAALLLAQRMLLARKGRGLYFALPTMATADAMFRRVSRQIGRMFAQPPSLTLAHGRAGLSAEFRDLVLRPAAREGEGACTQWLAESRRRALLADVGIGTIDQALLAALPVRFQALRHFGLSSKILIVDEVHEMGEAYIATELEMLLRMHRAAGGSAILLTATLPLEQRSRLMAVYGGQSRDAAYPALSVAGGAAITRFEPDPRPVRGPVAVRRLASEEEAVALMCAQARAGAACVWIRNAVDDAIAAAGMLEACGVEARLLHARFALCDRKRIEAEVDLRVGKDGTQRQGFVLVGTQVLESSLDYDFDVMISDLAPMASLVQRAGRLWRHIDRRPASARPVPGPELHVLSPDPDVLQDARWLHDVLDRGAWVYPVADLWRTARVLFARGQIEAPGALRSLIEAVHGQDAEPVPPALEQAEIAALGIAAAHRGRARQNVIDYAAGYRSGARGARDADYPTRLGAEQRVLALARWENGGLRPWAEGDGAQAWALSEISAARARLDALPLPDMSLPALAAAVQDWPEWKRASVRLCPVEATGQICSGLRYDRESGLSFTVPD